MNSRDEWLHCRYNHINGINKMNCPKCNAKKKSGYSRFEPTAPTLISPPNPSIKIDTKARISISIQ